MFQNIVPPFDPKPAMPIRPPTIYVPNPVRWEYKLIKRDLEKEQPLDEDELNALGKDGWELAGIAQQPSKLLYHFKRLLD